MKMMLRFALATAFATAAAAPAAAGDLRLSIANGRVTLVAKDVTVGQILAEWAKVGQTRIVNGEKLVGGPVTLELTDVPEAQALDTVLRTAAGYVMAPRMAGSAGASIYDRILILASSRPPVVTAAPPAPFTNRPMPQMPQNVAPDDEPEFVPPGGVPVVNPAAGQPVSIMPPMVQPAAPAAPLTATRPGQLPAPAPAAPPTANPYLGTPPGPTAPTYNPVPPPPIPPTATRPGVPNTGRGGGG